MPTIIPVGITPGMFEVAEALVGGFFHSPPAGRFAANVKLLSVSNAVGGANLGISMDNRVLLRVLKIVTQRNFTGKISPMCIGEGADRMTFTVLWFDPGSIQLVGAHNADTIRLAVQYIVQLFRRYGFPATIRYISIDNRVAQGEMFPIALEKLHNKLPDYVTTYIPGSFPGLVCEHTKGGATFMVFGRGRTMALGISDFDRATRQYLGIAAIAERVAMDTNEGQMNKSRERAILQHNQQNSVPDEENARNERVAKAVHSEVNKFLKSNPLNHPETPKKLRELIAEVSARAIAEMEAAEAQEKTGVKRKATSVHSSKRIVSDMYEEDDDDYEFNGDEFYQLR